ncbi:nuclear transport factor 2 family protein [Massilia sp. S19_KUP03_FR1]|uniref:nuclear transport factor 2 family protein n=1 Tax=Massilia sp. S19_KUP03_FR1 TaxID=3025503 RepID=UPI002FCD9604
MTLHLPQPIAAFFLAHSRDGEDVSDCFSGSAVVTDEGKAHHGTAAIKQWHEAASKKFTYTCQPFAAEQRDGKTVVTSQLVGNFPGSPVDLRYAFVVNGDKIASLEIAP